MSSIAYGTTTWPLFHYTIADWEPLCPPMPWLWTSKYHASVKWFQKYNIQKKTRNKMKWNEKSKQYQIRRSTERTTRNARTRRTYSSLTTEHVLRRQCTSILRKLFLTNGYYCFWHLQRAHERIENGSGAELYTQWQRGLTKQQTQSLFTAACSVRSEPIIDDMVRPPTKRRTLTCACAKRVKQHIQFSVWADSHKNHNAQKQ